MNPNLSRWLAGLITLSLFLGAVDLPVRAQNPGASNDLSLMVGKSTVITSAERIERVAIGFGDVAEAMAAGTNEVLVSGKAPGSTSLIIWQVGGGKLMFDVNVRPNPFVQNTRLDSVRREIAKELPGQQITVSSENDAIFLRGQVKDTTNAARAVSIASTVGKVVNLLYVEIPPAEQQILLKVRFASVDRSASTQIGMNLFSTGATNTIGRTSTGQFVGPTLPQNPTPNNATKPFVFSDLLNIFLFRPDLNLGATIEALEAKNLIQMLAEPNVLAQDGKFASFLAGGEFPYPVVQSTGTGGTPVVTIQFHEFGVRLNFVPTLTARGTIKLKVSPEVSALDYTNGLNIEGFTVPALTTRKVNTEVELGEGQSFAIGGLLDKRLTDTFQKMPLIGDIPVLGKFFQSKSTSRNNTELLVIVTPELVRPIPAGTPPMTLPFPKPFMQSSAEDAVRTPGVQKTGTVQPSPEKAIPLETLLQSIARENALDENGPAKRSGSTQDVLNQLSPQSSQSSGPK